MTHSRPRLSVLTTPAWVPVTQICRQQQPRPEHRWGSAAVTRHSKSKCMRSHLPWSKAMRVPEHTWICPALPLADMIACRQGLGPANKQSTKASFPSSAGGIEGHRSLLCIFGRRQAMSALCSPGSEQTVWRGLARAIYFKMGSMCCVRLQTDSVARLSTCHSF